MKKYLGQLLHYITPGSLKILSNKALIYTNSVVKQTTRRDRRLMVQVKVKVKFTLAEAMKAQRGRGYMALLFFILGASLG